MFERKKNLVVPSFILTLNFKLLATFFVFNFFVYFDRYYSDSFVIKEFLFLFYSYSVRYLLSELNYYAASKSVSLSRNHIERNPQ